jgi:hypothetical protein
MKNLFAVIFTSFALIQGVFSQTEKQQITSIDKAVLEINNNLKSYRKILNEQDSLMAVNNTNNSFTETVYKNANDLVLIQYSNKYGNMISSNNYLKNGQLIFIEIKNRDNSYEKSYFNNNTLIAKYINENAVDITSTDYKQVEKSTLLAIDKVVMLYNNK